MKILPLATSLLLATFVTASGQTKPKAANDSQASQATRARVLNNEIKPVGSLPQSLQAHAKVEKNDAGRVRTVETETSTSPVTTTKSNPVREPAKAATAPMTTPISMASTQIYKVGPLDVLDIQLVDRPTRESTLFTVLENGVLDYPLAGASINVVGMTPMEIAGVLRQRIKIFENPKVAVSVRDFASHRVTISGLVGAPGKKSLRREAVPLYALLTEALVLPEAARATVTRNGRPPMMIDLKDPHHAATLITAGDVIKVTGPSLTATEFFYIGGAINSPGQKPFHSGLTLTQAILASGGTSAAVGDRVKISRLGNNGRLISQEHSLRKVQLGKAIDPVLQKGDRIEVFPAK